MKYTTEKVSLWLNDCFKVFPEIRDKSVDMILADLPYGTTACAWDSILPLDKLWKEYKRIIKDNGAIVLTASQPFTWKLCASNPEWFRYEIIWEKPNGTNPMLIKKQPFKVHESILVFYEKQPTYNPQMTYGHSTYSGFSDDNKKIGEVYGDNLISKHKENKDGSRYPRSVQKFSQDRKKGHPTKKPVELMEWLIKTYTNEGELVLDNTMGEGSTGIAALKNKRRFYGIELEKKYYDNALIAIKEVSNV
jgi:site-specific DNA-methyltransferase (adenine-specific)